MVTRTKQRQEARLSQFQLQENGQGREGERDGARGSEAPEGITHPAQRAARPGPRTDPFHILSATAPPSGLALHNWRGPWAGVLPALFSG